MNWPRKDLIATAVVFIFALAVWCAGLSTPAGAFASQVPDCPSSTAEHPCSPLLCNLAASHNLLSQGAIVSTRPHDSGKDGLVLLGAVLPVSSHGEISLAVKQFPAIWTDYRSEKISVHLFNSVLTL